MRVTGIICEYNPFHEGHRYLIEQARKRTDSEYIVCIMSGDFVQRGEPSIVSKYNRTRAALEGGADLVFELPLRFCISSAGDFAYGGVKALTLLPFVTDLFFGSEWGEIDLFLQTADALANESEDFSHALKTYAGQGLSFAAARERALMETYHLPHSLLSKPNNILGTEYCVALKKCNSTITPHTVKRVGSGYHDTQKSDRFPSATALRQALSASDKPHLQLDDFSDMVLYALRREDCLERYKDISTDLSYRLSSLLDTCHSLTELVEKCQTRAFTENRIRRALFQVLFGLTDTDISLPFLRLLGMKKTAGNLLRQVTDCQILNHLASDKEKLSTEAKHLLQKDILASDLYRTVWCRKYGEHSANEYQHSPMIL